MSSDRFANLPKPVRDALATAVGLGVLGYQQLQVQRRSFEKSTGIAVSADPSDIRNVIRHLTERS